MVVHHSRNMSTATETVLFMLMLAVVVGVLALDAYAIVTFG